MNGAGKTTIFKMAINWAMRHPAALLAAIPATASILFIDSCTFPWCDELCLCDGMFMKALRGLEWSTVSPCSYNPFYPLLVYVWAKIFGASHFAVISLSVAIGYVACVCIAAIARRRKWWSSTWADTAFVFLFWGGWEFAPELTTARPDVLALLLTAIFADALAREGTKGHHLLRTFIAAAVLFFAAPYPLPLMFFFGLFLLASADNTKERKTILLRGFAATGGFLLGFAVVAGYYALQMDLIRLLGSYVYFNSITGYAPEPFWERIVCGYSRDALGPLLCILALLTGRLKGKAWPLAVFILSIPLLMTIGGRYAHYYLWTFYVPCLLLAVCALSRRGSKSVAALAMAGIALWAAYHAVSYTRSKPQRDFTYACRNFVDSNSDFFGKDVDVIVAENVEGRCDFYYPLLKHGARVWFRGENALAGRSDEEKFMEGLTYIPCNEEQRKAILNFIAKIQRFVPLLPNNALVLFYSDDDVKNIKPIFESKGCEFKPIKTEGSFSLWKMRRAQNDVNQN